jgi:hypothetical protein
MADDVRARITRICAALPEVAVSGEQHLAFKVRGKTFAYYLDDHHGDGVVGLCCKAAPGELASLTGAEPDRFYRPAYLGAKGWVGFRLDTPEVDWEQARELVLDAYGLTAPKRLLAALD